MTIYMLSMMICMALMSVSLMSLIKNKNKEKLYPFECGFNPISNPHTPFSIQFFKILLIFLMFDMEIIVIIPLPLMPILLKTLNIIIMIMLLVLLIGLIFEWKEGSLQWLH